MVRHLVHIIHIVYLLIFTIILVVIYVQSSVVFAYLGFESDLELNTRAVLLTIILCCGLPLYKSVIDRSTILALNTFIVLSLIPLYVVTLCNSNMAIAPLFYLLVSLFFYNWFNKSITFKRVRKIRLDKHSFYSIILILSSIFIIIVHIGYGLNFNVPTLEDIYLVRDDYKEDSSRLSTYAFNGLCRVIIPVFFVIGLIRRSSFFIVIALIIQLFLYGIGGHKFTLFILPLIFIFYLIIKNTNQLKSSTLSLALIVFSGTVAVTNYVLDTFTIFSSIAIRRLFFTPSLMHQYYFDYFEDNPKDYFAQHFPFSIFLESNYNQDIPYLIGSVYLSNFNAHANANVFANGYANIGLLSIVIIPFILIIVFKTFDQLFQPKDNKFIFPLLLTPIIFATNTGIITLLVTHGLLFLLFITLITPEKIWSIKRIKFVFDKKSNNQIHSKT